MRTRWKRFGTLSDNRESGGAGARRDGGEGEGGRRGGRSRGGRASDKGGGGGPRGWRHSHGDGGSSGGRRSGGRRRVEDDKVKGLRCRLGSRGVRNRSGGSGAVIARHLDDKREGRSIFGLHGGGPRRERRIGQQIRAGGGRGLGR